MRAITLSTLIGLMLLCAEARSQEDDPLPVEDVDAGPADAAPIDDAGPELETVPEPVEEAVPELETLPEPTPEPAEEPTEAATPPAEEEQAGPEKRELELELEEPEGGWLSKQRYVAGGITGSVVGLGVGHLIVGEWTDFGWFFTTTQALGAGMFFTGFLVFGSSDMEEEDVPGGENMTPEELEAKADEMTNEKGVVAGIVVAVTGAAIYGASYIWEKVDLFQRPNDRLRPPFETAGPVALELDLEVPDDGWITRSRYAVGGTVGTVFGLGLGHAIVDEWKSFGWVYTATQAFGLTMVGGGLLGHTIATKEPDETEEGTQEAAEAQTNRAGQRASDAIMYTGLAILGLSLLVEKVDLWVRPHDRLEPKPKPEDPTMTWPPLEATGGVLTDPSALAPADPAAEPWVLKHAPPKRAKRDHPIGLYVEANPDADIKEVRLYLQLPGEASFESFRMQRNGNLYGKMIGCDDFPSLDPSSLEYYIEAFGDEGWVVATEGRAEDPLRIALAPDDAFAGEQPNLPGMAEHRRCKPSDVWLARVEQATGREHEDDFEDYLESDEVATVTFAEYVHRRYHKQRVGGIVLASVAAPILLASSPLLAGLSALGGDEWAMVLSIGTGAAGLASLGFGIWLAVRGLRVRDAVEPLLDESTEEASVRLRLTMVTDAQGIPSGGGLTLTF